MWSKLSSALKQRDGNDSDHDHSESSDTQSSRPDPFHVDGATYYTHQTPHTARSGVHSRSASREEDLIWSLRTQLALQRELCAQFEIDLGARDELVQALTTRLDASEKENDKRRGVIRTWRKKAADLEKLCRHLEVEVESSRQENMERSIMDEASGEALRQLHRQISQLEREKSEVEAQRNSLAQTVESSEAEIARLRGKLDDTDQASGQTADELSRLRREKSDVETERDNFSSEIARLRVHIQQLQKDSAAKEVAIVQLNKQHDQDKEDIDGLNIALESKQQELELVKRKHGGRASGEPIPGRTHPAPSATGKPVVQHSKVQRTPAIVARTLSPVSPKAPSALGRATNTRPPLSSGLRRASNSSVEAKPSDRRASIANMPSDEKENATTTVSLKNKRRTMIAA